MRILREKSLFIAIDYQDRLLPAVASHEELLANTEFLIKGLQLLQIPLAMTTQYEKGLGKNVSSVRNLIGEDNSFDKITFSIWQDERIRQYIRSTGALYILIGGTESHICVLQSVIDLKEAGFIPVLITDCVGSRDEQDKEAALLRARQEGAILTSSEALLYELMATADDPSFKRITALVKEHHNTKYKE